MQCHIDVVSERDSRRHHYHLLPRPSIKAKSKAHCAAAEFPEYLKRAQTDGEEQQTNEQRMMQLPWSDFRYDKQVVMFVPEANSMKLYKECTYSLF